MGLQPTQQSKDDFDSEQNDAKSIKLKNDIETHANVSGFISRAANRARDKSNQEFYLADIPENIIQESFEHVLSTRLSMKFKVVFSRLKMKNIKWALTS